LKYLNSLIDPQYHTWIKDHVTGIDSTCSTFAWLIYTRIVEANCQRFGIPYESGHPQAEKRKIPNGPHLSVNDIVLALPHIGIKTFHNYRGWHNRAKHALAVLDKMEARDKEQAYLFVNLTELLRTPLVDVGKLEPSRYGRMNELQAAIKKLERELKDNRGRAK
jgi:hypothetical protein